MQQGSVKANGINFHYISEGDGPLVLLLHGYPDTGRTWSHLIPALARAGYRAVAPNTRASVAEEMKTLWSAEVTTEILRGAGHFLHREKPAEVERLVLDWLAAG